MGQLKVARSIRFGARSFRGSLAFLAMRLATAAAILPALLSLRAPRRTSVRLCEPAEYDLTLTKPLGIAFEETASGFGLEVTEVVEGGSAHEDGSIWPGDLLLKVGGRDVAGLDFDGAMAALVAADEARCKLTLGRVRGKMGALRFGGEDAELIFSKTGVGLPPLARKAKFDVKYSCNAGSCGSCSVLLYDEETEEYRPTRLCKAQLPEGDRASLMPLTVFRPDSPQAKEYEKAMEEKAGKLI